MIARKNRLLFIRHGFAESDNLQQVLQSVGVEQVVSALPEDVGQVAEEHLQDLLDLSVLLAVDQEEDRLTGAEGIRPLFHLQSDLELMLTNLE
jgi:hypothetical protein